MAIFYPQRNSFINYRFDYELSLESELLWLWSTDRISRYVSLARIGVLFIADYYHNDR